MKPSITSFGIPSLFQFLPEWRRAWAKDSYATEITEFFEKISELSVGSVAKPMTLATPVSAWKLA